MMRKLFYSGKSYDVRYVSQNIVAITDALTKHFFDSISLLLRCEVALHLINT